MCTLSPISDKIIEENEETKGENSARDICQFWDKNIIYLRN